VNLIQESVKLSLRIQLHIVPTVRGVEAFLGGGAQQDRR